MSHPSSKSFGQLSPVRTGGRRRPASLCALALALVLPALMVLSACVTGSRGLPSSLVIPLAAALKILTAGGFPAGEVGIAYSFAITFTGGTPNGSGTFGCSATNLPPGLTISSVSVIINGVNACQISGSPTAVFSGTTVVTISDSSVPPQLVQFPATGPGTFTITPPFTFINFVPQTGEVGAAYSETFNSMGGNGNLTSCTLSPAISGLSTSFSGTTCTISGTPTAPFGPANITLIAQDTGNASSPKATAMTTGMLTIQPALAVSAITFGPGEVGAVYILALATTGGILPLTVCNFSPALPAGLSVAINGANCVVSGTPTVAFGPTTLTLTATDSGSSSTAPQSKTNSGSLTVFARLAVPAFVLGVGEQGANYSVTIPTTGGILPITTCMVAGLPAGTGLSVTPSSPNCVLSGTPTAADVGTRNITITATDTGDAATATPPVSATSAATSLTINARLAVPAFVLGTGEQSAAYSQTIPTTGGILPITTCMVAGLPGGTGLSVTVSSPNCVLMGTPTAADVGTRNITITATDTGDAATATPPVSAPSAATSLTILARVSLTTTFAAGGGETSAGFSHSFPIMFGNPPYNCTLDVASTLPAGLAVSTINPPLPPACVVSGTPTATFGPTSVQIDVKDTPASTSQTTAGMNFQASSLQIFPGITFANFTLGNGVQGQVFNQTGPPSFSGGNPNYTCTFTGTVPAGLTTVWNAATACNVTGAGGGNVATATFGLPLGSTVTILVTDTPRSADQTTSATATANSQANFTIFSPLVINVPMLVNGFLNFTYPGITFTASGGFGAGVTWTGPPGVAPCAPTGTIPLGLTLGAVSGALTGTPITASAVDADFTFQVCVKDNTSTTSTAASFTTSASLTINVLDQLAFASGTGNSSAQVINTRTNSFVSGVALPAGAAPRGVAVHASGKTAYVADFANNTIIPIDTITRTAGAPVPLPAPCAGPSALAATLDPVKAGRDRLYVTCLTGFDVVILNTSNPMAPTFLTHIGVGVPVPGVAIQSDNSRAFIVSGTTNAIGYIDNTAAFPVLGPSSALNGASAQPNQISVVANGARVYAYISKQSPSSIEVEDVTPFPPVFVTNIFLPVGPNNPDAIAFDLALSNVYVTLPGTNQFAVFNNAAAIPSLTGIFGLPTPLLAGTDSAGGLTIPATSSGTFPFRAYFTVPGANKVDIIDDNAAPPPVADPGAFNPIAVTAASAPGRIASIPNPGDPAGTHLKFLTGALADGVANRTYTEFVVLAGGTSPYTCSASGLPAGVNITPGATTVPGGPPQGGKPACMISGTPAAATAATVTVTATDLSAPPQMFTRTFSLNTRNEFAFNALTLLPNGVVGRTYGAPPLTSPVETTNVSATVGNSPLAMCSVAGQGANPLVTAVSASTGCSLSSGGAMLTTAGAPFNLTFSATDTPITDPFTTLVVTPAKTIAAASTVALQVNPVLAIMTTQAQIPNALINFPYPQAPTTVTFTVAPGTGDGTAVMWRQAGSAGVICAAPAGTMPTGINIAAATGVLSGTPTAASATAAQFGFNVCVEDIANSATPGGSFTTASPYVLNVMNAFAYAAAPGTKTIEVFSTSNASSPNMPITSICAGTGTKPPTVCAATGAPNGVAVTPNGRFAIVTEQNTDQIDVIDTITNTKLTNSPFALPAANQCGTPVGVAVDAKFVYITCDLVQVAPARREEVLALDAVMLTTGGGTFSAVTEFATGVGSVPEGVAFNTAGTRAYVTLKGNDKLMIIDTTLATPAPIAVTQGGNPAGVFNLPTASASPRGIAVLQNTASLTKDYAYIAKQAAPTGTITYVSASTTTCVTAGATNTPGACTLTAPTTTGNTVIVMVASRPAATITGVTDNAAGGSSVYSAIAGCPQSSGAGAAQVNIQCFATAPNASKAATTVTVATSTTSQFAVGVVEFSGVQAFGNTNRGTDTANNTPSISVTTQDNNNFCVAGFAQQTAQTFTATTGIVLTQGSSTGANNITGAIMDNSVATGGNPCTTAATSGGTMNYAFATVELRSVGNTGVDVVDVTVDPTPAGLTVVTSIPEGSTSAPFIVAGLPGAPSGRAYVSLLGSNQFDVLDNTVATPVRIAGAPFNLPDPTLAAAAVSPVGVVIPSITPPFKAYFAFNASGLVGLIDDGTPPTIDATANITLTGGGTSAPTRVAAIPVPK